MNAQLAPLNFLERFNQKGLLHNENKIRTDFKNSKQKAAYQLLRREEMKEQKSRLECVLVQQYTCKYGTKQHSPINVMIKEKVSSFLDSIDIDQAQTKLGNLEASIQDCCTSLRAQLKNHDQNRSEMNNSADTKYRRNDSVSSYKSTELSANDWSVINTIKSLSEEQKARHELEKAAERKRQFKNELDRQQEEHGRQKEDQLKEKKRLAELSISIQKSVEEDERQARQKREMHHIAERTIRLSQIDERKKQREVERQMKIDGEQRDMARARRLIEEEEIQKHASKEKQKKAQDELLIENERNKALKAEELRKQWEYEKKLNREYTEKLDREEEARTKAFKDRLDALNKAGSAYASQVGRAIQEKSALTEQRTMAEVERKLREDEDREIRKAEQRKREILKSFEFNSNIVDRKRQEKERERMEAIATRKRLEQDIAAQAVEEKRKEQARRQNAWEVKLRNDEQVHMNRQHMRSFSALSSTEINMNKSILQKLDQDEDLKIRLIQKLKPTVSPASDLGFAFA